MITVDRNSVGNNFKSKPQCRKIGTGAGRACKPWMRSLIGYIQGRAERDFAQSLVDSRKFKHYLSDRWLMDIIGLKPEWVAHYNWRQSLGNSTPVLKNLRNRINKVYLVALARGYKPGIGGEHPLNRGHEDLKTYYQIGFEGRTP